MNFFLKPFNLIAANSLLTFVFVTLPLPKLSIPLAIAQTTETQNAEGNRLFQQGLQRSQTNQIQEAIQSFQQALEQYRAAGDRPGESRALVVSVYFHSQNLRHPQTDETD
jgi:outer membrane protein assembly factor BamD (BamD/ComL family)